LSLSVLGAMAIKKVRIAQATLVFGIAAGVLIGLPGFARRVGARVHEGLILVNGRIEGREVAVGTKLPGRVLRLYVVEGQQVKAGQLLAELEADDVRASYEQVRANVQQAQHNLRSAKEQVIRSQQQLAKAKLALRLTTEQTELAVKQAAAAVAEAKAGVAQAEARLNTAKTVYDHAKALQGEAASNREFTDARDSWEAHKAAVQIAKCRLEQANKAHELAVCSKSQVQMCKYDLAVMESTVRQAEEAVGIAQAQVKAAEALAKIIEIKLKEAKINAPCDGVVVTRVVEPGEVVPAGATIAVVIDFDRLYMKAYLPNKLIGKVKLNDPARVFLDAFANRHFEARVTKIHQQAEFTPKNVDTPQQRVKLVFGLELTVVNTERLVKPGMPADGVIRIEKAAPWRSPADLR